MRKKRTFLAGIISVAFAINAMGTAGAFAEEIVESDLENSSEYVSEIEEADSGIEAIGTENLSDEEKPVKSDGVRKSGWYQESNGKWRYYYNDYQYATGWTQIDNKWYYFDSLGYMHTGWLSYNGHWYFFASSGAMVTGWKQISGDWYFFKSNGIMQTGWRKLNGYWYYFGSNGKMVTGYHRIDGIDYYFGSDGKLSYDASIVATVYTKDYGFPDINTLSDGQLVSLKLGDSYTMEMHNNYIKADFTGTDANLPIAKANKGVFYYSGHGHPNGGGLDLGVNQTLTPSELRNLGMNNTKVAFFFCCYGAKINPTSSLSMVTAAIAGGAKASFGYKIESDLYMDHLATEVIMTRMMMGESLSTAVNTARGAFPTYEPLMTGNYALAGDTSVQIDDTYTLRDTEELIIPEGFEQSWSEDGISVFRKYYNGIETSDRIVYNCDRGYYALNRNEIRDAQLSTIDFDQIERNREMLQNSVRMSQYSRIKEYITVIDGRATVVLVGSKIVDEMLKYDCFDLGTNEDLSDDMELIAYLI